MIVLCFMLICLFLPSFSWKKGSFIGALHDGARAIRLHIRPRIFEVWSITHRAYQSQLLAGWWLNETLSQVVSDDYSQILTRGKQQWLTQNTNELQEFAESMLGKYGRSPGGHFGCYYPGPCFNINMLSHQYRKSHCGDKTVVRSSYLHNGVSYTGKMSSLYWFRALLLCQIVRSL